MRFFDSLFGGIFGLLKMLLVIPIILLVGMFLMTIVAMIVA